MNTNIWYAFFAVILTKCDRKKRINFPWGQSKRCALFCDWFWQFLFFEFSRDEWSARTGIDIVSHTPLKGALCVYTQGMFERDRRRWKERVRTKCPQGEKWYNRLLDVYVCDETIGANIVCVCRSKLLLFWEKAAQKCACRVRETKNERKNRKREKCVGLILEQKSKEVVLCKNCQKCFLEPLLISVSNDSKYRLYPCFASYFTFN